MLSQILNIPPLFYVNVLIVILVSDVQRDFMYFSIINRINQLNELLDFVWNGGLIGPLRPGATNLQDPDWICRDAHIVHCNKDRLIDWAELNIP